MSAPDFDKTLQEKVQQLRLEPSPRVWEGVAEQLQQKRRRRGLIWIFSAAALVTGIAFFVAGIAPGNKVFEKSNPSGSIPEIQAGTNRNQNQIKTQTIDQKSTLPVEQTLNENIPPASTTGKTGIGETKKLPKETTNGEWHESTARHRNKKASGLPASFQKTLQSPGSRKGKSERLTEMVHESVELPREILAANINATLNLADGPLVLTPAEKKADNQISSNLLHNNKISKPDKWHSSIVFGAGASTMVGNGLRQYNSLANEYLAAVSVPSGIAAIQQRPSDVTAGPAFHAGAQVSRSFTKKLSAGIGIQYAYFSNRITVGNTPDSSVAIYNNRQELISSDATFKAAGNSGRSFYNQFHFIQVPLELSLGLDRKQRWSYNAGISIGYLIGMNALQYNNQAGVYYRNNDSYDRWQTTFMTGFQYKFLKSGKYPLMVGPYAQYQLNSIEKSISNKHLLAYGLQAKFQLK